MEVWLCVKRLGEQCLLVEAVRQEIVVLGWHVFVLILLQRTNVTGLGLGRVAWQGCLPGQ